MHVQTPAARPAGFEAGGSGADSVDRTPIATLLIGGNWRSGTGTFDVTDPATGAVIGQASDSGVVEVLAALDAASTAFADWKATPVETRSSILHRAADAIRAEADSLASVMTAENGKPLAESRGEILNSARMLEWSAQEARRACGRTVPNAAQGPSMVLTQPVGPVLAISPWNFPASMLVRKIAMALAAGCTVIAKPADLTPLIAVAIIRTITEAGIPAGVLNLITTTDPAGVTAALMDDPRLRKISFTGSTRVGLGLAEANGSRLRRLSLEMGGHSPAIVLPDAEIEAAASAIVASKFANAGQSCIAVNRLYVHEDLASDLVDAIVRKTEALTVGHGAAEGTDVGPLINDAALAKVTAQVDDAVSKGARVVTGGAVWTPADKSLAGAFYQPTVLVDVDETMLISREETFGPVLAVYTYTDRSEAVAKANDSEYGLAAYVFGRDVAELWKTFDDLEFGVIGVNDPFPVRPELPFGGLKNSGQEREGGSEGIEAYLETKAVSLRF
ncbi:NAD-dependent succinate-semialdehyde dehydrogenase [Rhodococcus sp. NPDC057014]|uniref:NAD-dependent succinate-semialdehyde dehydrogenase n=1 Tax=Rhodococcus sp. NPDC057014 TaxID=3346000 RepID=UPI0036336576